MKTYDEIVAFYEAESKNDFLGFTADVLLPYLPVEKVKPFLKEDADLSEWKTVPLTEESVITEMRGYMEFAWGKAQDHRGISASRSVEKMSAWLWLLGDEETLSFAKDGDNYRNYGAPILKKICEVYQFPIPDDEGIKNMSEGKPCYPGRDSGCG